jgi:hypothetical protein
MLGVDRKLSAYPQNDVNDPKAEVGMCPMEQADHMPRSIGTLREHDNLRSLTDAGDDFELCIALIAQTSLLEDVHEQARVT